MKRLSTGVLSAVLMAGLGLSAVAAPLSASHGNIGPNAIAQATTAPSPAATAMASPASTATMAPSMAPAAPAAPASMPAADFGSPPSGQIPIFFNDRHVYTKPDKLKQGRVLAALVRGGTILIPLRSMFEQMGATVNYDPASKTVDVTKPGADVKVTVGRPEVVINGETRPLDVPPEMYQGHVVVPVRVISEGMGAYVQWVPDRRIVVVRYAPPTPTPTAAPTEAPTAPPTPTPTPVPTPNITTFVAGDYIISPKVYNEFSPGNTGNNNSGGFSYRIHGAFEFNLLDLPWMIEGDYRQFNYPHNQLAQTTALNQGQVCDGLNGHAAGGDPGCVTAIGGQFSTFVPAFTARDYDGDARLGLKVLDPKIYIGVGYMWRSGNYGYPRLTGVGAGLEKLPDLQNNGFTWYGSYYYYPNVKGSGTGCLTLGCVPPGSSYDLQYNIMKYDIGGAFTFGQNVPLYIEFGFLGDRGLVKTNAPVGFSENGPYVGLGLKF
ncbi:MAG TPA: copper amine oxidase N-terminal domain-containing protein [Candidatus Baltobacteraceae bacterium]|nr:copper amine oxidase N-terminal domain-containing protein [Candidatus Baltobacteraceae bacterium]